MIGVIGPREAVVMLAYLVDVALGRNQRCADDGGETRPQYLHVYANDAFAHGPKGATAYVVGDNGSVVTEVIAAARANVADGTATIADYQLAALPAPAALDASFA